MATVTIFPIAATHSTPRVSASVSYSGAGAAVFNVLSNTWATDSPSIAVTFVVEQSFDGGVTWQGMCAATWRPQSFAPRTGALPNLRCTATDVLGSRLLRATLSASASIQVGVSATVS
jgi:hypothetical protein